MTDGRGADGRSGDSLLEALALLVATTVPLPPCAGSERLHAVHAAAARGVQIAVADLLGILERLGPTLPGRHGPKDTGGLS